MTPTRPRPAAPRARLRAARAAAALAALAAAPALADITAQEVREEFEATYEGFDWAVEVGSEEASDDAVTLRDVVLSFEFEPGGPPASATPPEEAMPPEDAPAPVEVVRVEARFAEMAFEGRPDGTVAVTLPPEGTMTTRATREDGTEDTSESRLFSEGFEMTVAEVEGEAAEPGRRYGYAAERIGVELVEATRGGEPVEAEGEVIVSGFSGTTEAVPAPDASEGARRYTGDDRIEGLALRLDLPAGEEGEEGSRLEVSYDLADLTMRSEGTVPDGEMFAESSEDPAALFDAGLAFDVGLEYGAGTGRVMSVGGADPSEDFAYASSGEGGGLEMTFDGERWGFGGDARGLRYVVESPGLPMGRVDAALEEASAEFAFPVAATEEALPFTVRYGFSGLTLNEEVWALFDPEGLLSRDPASILVAVGGRIRLLADLWDDEAQAEAGEAEELPAEVEEASIEMRLEAAGASVEATGDFTFDNADTTTFPGSPAPTGTLDVTASGIDALLDTLSEMGLVPPDQLMPARMMLGLFARPDGEGGYVSAIEVNGATGEVTANGQRLR